MWALIEAGNVAQVFPQPTAFTAGGIQYPAEWFYSSSPEEKAAVGLLPLIQDAIPAGFHAVSSTYEILITEVLQHFETEADPLPEKAALKNYARSRELLIEESGIVFGAITIPTTRDAQGVISRAAAYAAAPDPISRTINVENMAGSYTTITLAEVNALARSVEEHVLAAIDAAATIALEIDAGTITTYAEIDASPLWPPVPPPAIPAP